MTDDECKLDHFNWFQLEWFSGFDNVIDVK